MRLEEIMSTPVHTVDMEASPEVAWNRMHTLGIHHLVVMDRGSVVGIVSDRDLGGSHGEKLRGKGTIRDWMSSHVVTADSSTSVRKAANLFRGRTIGCLPIMDRGKLVGIVTTSDLLDLVGRGSERPVAHTRRWTLRHRGLRQRKSTISH
jgi:acetoin utilization protein AcuB